MRLIITTSHYLRTHTLPVLFALSLVARLVSLLSVDSAKLPEAERDRAERVTSALSSIGRAVLLLTESIQVICEVIRGIHRPVVASSKL